MSLAIVDAHHHFQDLGNHHYPWLAPGAPAKLEGDLGPIRRDYLPADYQRDLGGVELVASVHVQNGWDPSDPVGETIWLEAQADRNGTPTAIVAFADLASPDAGKVLAAHAGFPRVRGIRQILNWHPDPDITVTSRNDWMRDPAWRAGFAQLAEHRLSFDLQIFWPQMAMAHELAVSFPETTIILEHFGMPIDRSPQGVAQWDAAMRNLAKAPNVTVKMSGFGLGHPKWTAADTVPLLRRTIDIFGPDRTMVGTNLPVDLLFASSGQILSAIEASVEGLSPTDRASVLRDTAMRVYRL